MVVDYCTNDTRFVSVEKPESALKLGSGTSVHFHRRGVGNVVVGRNPENFASKYFSGMKHANIHCHRLVAPQNLMQARCHSFDVAVDIAAKLADSAGKCQHFVESKYCGDSGSSIDCRQKRQNFLVAARNRSYRHLHSSSSLLHATLITDGRIDTFLCVPRLEQRAGFLHTVCRTSRIESRVWVPRNPGTSLHSRDHVSFYWGLADGESASRHLFVCSMCSNFGHVVPPQSSNSWQVGLAFVVAGVHPPHLRLPNQNLINRQNPRGRHYRERHRRNSWLTGGAFRYVEITALVLLCTAQPKKPWLAYIYYAVCWPSAGPLRRSTRRRRYGPW